MIIPILNNFRTCFIKKREAEGYDIITRGNISHEDFMRKLNRYTDIAQLLNICKCHDAPHENVTTHDEHHEHLFPDFLEYCYRGRCPDWRRYSDDKAEPAILSLCLYSPHGPHTPSYNKHTLTRPHAPRRLLYSPQVRLLFGHASPMHPHARTAYAVDPVDPLWIKNVKISIKKT